MCKKVLKKVQTPQGLTLSLSTTGGQTPKFCRKKGRKISFSQFWSLEICVICLKNHSRQTRALYGWNESKISTGRPHLCTPQGVKFIYFDQKYWCFDNNYHISAIKWCKAATLWLSQQSIIVFLENESQNNRKYLSVWDSRRCIFCIAGSRKCHFRYRGSRKLAKILSPSPFFDNGLSLTMCYLIAQTGRILE